MQYVTWRGKYMGFNACFFQASCSNRYVPRSSTTYCLRAENWTFYHELQWPDYLIMRIFQLHASTFGALLPGKFYFIALGRS